MGQDFLRSGYQRGSAFADLNNDGFLDLVITSLNRKPRILLNAGFLSTSDLRLHFGLGPETSAAAIEIQWPSGVTQTLKNSPADRILKIDEP